MALIFKGKTSCAICGEIIAINQECYGFPPFLSRTNKLYRYSDAAFHARCFNDWEFRDEYLDRFDTIEKEKSKLEIPQVPDGMSFSEFEKTDAYRKYVGKLNEIYKET